MVDVLQANRCGRRACYDEEAAAGGGRQAGLPPPPERVSPNTVARTIGPALPARIHATAKNRRCGRHRSRLPGLAAIDRSINQPID